MPRLGDASEMALIEFVEEAASKKNKRRQRNLPKSLLLLKMNLRRNQKKQRPQNLKPTEVAKSDAEAVTEDVQGEETAEESSSDAGEDSATEEVIDQPEVEESGEDSKVEKEDSEESK